jgi:proteasome lid subunit RPN8/RPN11
VTDPINPLYLTPDALSSLVDYCRSKPGEEVCGFIVGTEGLGQRIFPMRNVHLYPDRFYQMSEPEVVEFYGWLDREQPGLDVVAAFHSHPTTVPVMSSTDIAAARDLTIPYVIVSLKDPQPKARAWWVNLAAIGVRVVEQARIVVSKSQAAVEEPDAPYAFMPGNYVEISYVRQRKSEDFLTKTRAKILTYENEAVTLSPDQRQSSRPPSLLLERIRKVEIIRESPAAAALRRDMIAHVKHLAVVLASDGDMHLAPPLTQALTRAFPLGINVSIRKED